MKTASDRKHETNSAKDRRPQLRGTQVIFAGAAAIATLTSLSVMQTGGHATDLSASSVAPGPAGVGFATDDQSDPGWTPQPDPGVFPTNPGWSSQSDPGWNADPGWDFQPSPEN